MSIQEKIEIELKTAIKEKLEEEKENKEVASLNLKKLNEKINNLKFLKGELQRGESKEMADEEVVPMFVSLIRKQNEMRKKLEFTSKEYMESLQFVIDISIFLEQDVIDQIYIVDIQLIDWIEAHIDFSKYKNKMQSMKDIKTEFPYVDGNLIKKVLEKM